MYRKVYEIIGWTYEAGQHCLACAEARFPQLAQDQNARVLDNEGNEVRPVFLGDEFDYPPCCGTCLQLLDY